jgi:hypothetical protein
MEESCTWIAFHAHPNAFTDEEDYHPDYWGVFVCPALRPEPEELLKEVIGHRSLVLTQVINRRNASMKEDWGMNERLKRQINEQGYGLSLTRLHHSEKTAD